jgi:hypothetical protein
MLPGMRASIDRTQRETAGNELASQGKHREPKSSASGNPTVS